MPSTVVHLALAGLLAAALLGEAFDRRAVAVVLAVTILPDLDTFVGFVVRGAHRAALHNLLLPLLAAVLIWYDTRVRESSWLRSRFGATAPQVAWVSVAAFAFAGVGLDLFTGGANPFWPVHDQFYRVSGRFLYSTQRGIVQTFVEFGDGTVEAGQLGSTKEVHVSSGVDPSPGKEPANVDRVFPVAQSGWQLLLILSSLFVLWARFRETARKA